MPDPIPPKGDPEFAITSPTNGTSVGPTFSVTGVGPKNMQNLAAQVGAATMPAAQETDGFSWEAVFFAMTAGTFNVSASYANGFVPQSPTTISVTVVGDPGIAIEEPTGPPMMATGGSTAGNGNNPWDGWQVKGTYDPSKISEIHLFLTQRGQSAQVTAGRNATKLASINAMTKLWTCTLDFVPRNYRGQGFLVHYRAVQLHGGPDIYGTCVQPFTGPPSS